MHLQFQIFFIRRSSFPIYFSSFWEVKINREKCTNGHRTIIVKSVFFFCQAGRGYSCTDESWDLQKARDNNPRYQHINRCICQDVSLGDLGCTVCHLYICMQLNCLCTCTFAILLLTEFVTLLSLRRFQGSFPLPLESSVILSPSGHASEAPYSVKNK